MGTALEEGKQPHFKAPGRERARYLGPETRISIQVALKPGQTQEVCWDRGRGLDPGPKGSWPETKVLHWPWTVPTSARR